MGGGRVSDQIEGVSSVPHCQRVERSRECRLDGIARGASSHRNHPRRPPSPGANLLGRLQWPSRTTESTTGSWPRLRSAAEHSTTKAIKARLIAEAEQHERIVSNETEIRVQSPPTNSAPSDKPQRKRRGERPLNGSLSSSRLKSARPRSPTPLRSPALPDWAAIGTDREPTDSLRSRRIQSDRGGKQNT